MEMHGATVKVLKTSVLCRLAVVVNMTKYIQ
jgi:hypothetical protein